MITDNLDRRTLRFIDRVGDRHGALEVISLVERKKPAGESRWFCRCECGGSTTAALRQLQRGSVTSCGCRGRANLLQSAGRNKLAAGEASFRILYGQYERSAKSRAIPFELDRDQFRAITQKPCAYCGGEPDRRFVGGPKVNGPYICNGVDRFDNDRGYTLANCRPCCTECNMAKGRMRPTRWLAWLARIAIHRAPNITDAVGRPVLLDELLERAERGEGRSRQPIIAETDPARLTA